MTSNLGEIISLYQGIDEKKRKKIDGSNKPVNSNFCVVQLVHRSSAAFATAGDGEQEGQQLVGDVDSTSYA